MLGRHTTLPLRIAQATEREVSHRAKLIRGLHADSKVPGSPSDRTATTGHPCATDPPATTSWPGPPTVSRPVPRRPFPGRRGRRRTLSEIRRKWKESMRPPRAYDRPGGRSWCSAPLRSSTAPGCASTRETCAAVYRQTWTVTFAATQNRPHFFWSTNRPSPLRGVRIGNVPLTIARLSSATDETLWLNRDCVNCCAVGRGKGCYSPTSSPNVVYAPEPSSRTPTQAPHRHFSCLACCEPRADLGRQEPRRRSRSTSRPVPLRPLQATASSLKPVLTLPSADYRVHISRRVTKSRSPGECDQHE